MVTDTPRVQPCDERRPFADEPSLRFAGSTGSFPFFHSTTTRFEFTVDKTPSTPKKNTTDALLQTQSEFQPVSDANKGRLFNQKVSQDNDVSLLWRSRDNRKGRHALLLRARKSEYETEHVYELIERTNSPGAIRRGIRAMVTVFPYWDISWLLAIMFTLGSLVWIGNGFIIMLPVIATRTRQSQELHPASAWSAFAGGTIVLIASILLMLEATNAHQSGCFGWTIGRVQGELFPQITARPGHCRHHHCCQSYEAQSPRAESASDTDEDFRSAENTHYHQWEWWPSRMDLRSSLRELGFVACGVQLCSAILFWLTKFIAIPQVSTRLSVTAMDGAYWVPQLVACLGFIVSCCLIMIETQSRWYLPAVAVLGWHVGLWKLIGSVGFTVSAALRLLNQQNYPLAQYHSNLASFLGSWALLVGSLVQWYESLDKNPVVAEGFHLYSEYNEIWFRDVGAADRYSV